MKKFYFIALLSIIGINSSWGQYQLQNSGFEAFETGYNQEGQQPTGWKGSNVNSRYAQSAPANVRKTLVEQDNNGRTGNCVYLHSELAGALGSYAPAPAYISLGTPWNHVDYSNIFQAANRAIGGTIGGLDFSYRPDTLQLWIKRTSAETEDAHVAIYFWRGSSFGTSYKNKVQNCQTAGANRVDEEVDIRGTNTCTTSQQASLIGNGEWINSGQFTNWTLIKVPINYLSNSAPEKMNVIISASNYPKEGAQSTLKAGSKMWVDDLSLIYSSKIHDLRLNINGNYMPLQNFDQNTLNYTYEMGVDQTSIPQIQAFRSGRQLSDSEVSINYGYATTITVTAEDGSSTTTYTVDFVPNTKLKNILIDNTPIEGFNPSTMSYYVQREYGSNCPEISVETFHSEQTYRIINCSTIPNSATIEVSVPNSTHSSTYTINYLSLPQTENVLQNILVKNVPLPNFSPNRLEYSLSVNSEEELAAASDITVVKTNDSQVVEIQRLEDFTIAIDVSLRDGAVKTKYIIKQNVIRSSNSHLGDILINNVSIDDFSPSKFFYKHILQFGTKAIPEITAVKAEENQTVDVVKGFVNDTSFIYVLAADGTSRSVYKILFNVTKENIGEAPSEKDVCFVPTAKGVWKASCRKNNVRVVVYKSTGEIIYSGSVPVADPNDDLCKSSIGRQINLSAEGVYIFTFVYNNKNVVTSGKFVNK